MKIRTPLILLVLLLLAACGPLGQPSATEIVRRAEAAMETLEQAHAVVEVEAIVDGETMRVVGEGWMDGERARAEVREASAPEVVGTLLLSDGTRGWLVLPEMERVLTGEVEALAAYHAEQQAGLPEWELSSLTEMVDELLRITDQELLGSETIAGLDAWHLRLQPNEEAPRAWVGAGGAVELWIAKENDLPLQLRFSGSTLGEGRVTVLEWERDPTFAADLFTFTPPAGVEVVDVATLLPETMTLPEARAAAPFRLLSTAQDTPEAALVGVARVGEGYVQHFEGTGGTWTLVQSATLPDGVPAPDARPADGKAEAQYVQLRGVEGRIRHDDEHGHTTLVWQEEGVFHVLSGTLSREAALALADALE